MLLSRSPGCAFIACCLVAALYCIASAATPVVAFTTANHVSRRARALDKGFRLGPVARNGLAYEDVTIGPGRRVLPGDTVYCYYQGSFTTKGEGMFAKTTTTVFDEISTFSNICTAPREKRLTNVRACTPVLWCTVTGETSEVNLT